MKWKVVIIVISIIVVGAAIVELGAKVSSTESSPAVHDIHITMNHITGSEYASANITFVSNTSIVAYYNSSNFYLVNSSQKYVGNQSYLKNISVKPNQVSEGENYYYNLNGTYRAIVFSNYKPNVFYSNLNQSTSVNSGGIITIIGLVVMLIGLVSLVIVIFFPEPEED